MKYRPSEGPASLWHPWLALTISAAIVVATAGLVSEGHAGNTHSVSEPSALAGTEPGAPDVAAAAEDTGPGECESELAKLPTPTRP